MGNGAEALFHFVWLLTREAPAFRCFAPRRLGAVEPEGKAGLPLRHVHDRYAHDRYVHDRPVRPFREIRDRPSVLGLPVPRQTPCGARRSRRRRRIWHCAARQQGRRAALAGFGPSPDKDGPQLSRSCLRIARESARHGAGLARRGSLRDPAAHQSRPRPVAGQRGAATPRAIEGSITQRTARAGSMAM